MCVCVNVAVFAFVHDLLESQEAVLEPDRERLQDLMDVAALELDELRALLAHHGVGALQGGLGVPLLIITMIMIIIIIIIIIISSSSSSTCYALLFVIIVWPGVPLLLGLPQARLHSALLHSTLLYSTRLYSTLLYSNSSLISSCLFYSTLLFSTRLYSTLL